MLDGRRKDRPLSRGVFHAIRYDRGEQRWNAANRTRRVEEEGKLSGEFVVALREQSGLTIERFFADSRTNGEALSQAEPGFITGAADILDSFKRRCSNC
jgi:hypothetical protein